MTLTGTNSYVIDCGDGTALVIDPGPPIERHIAALVDTAASQERSITRIVLTHGHGDHASGAEALRAATRARVYAHPKSTVAHDIDLPLEGTLEAGSIRLRTIDAPGHTFDHAIFYLPAERALFTGDTILGEGTTLIAPPGGAMRPYQRTLQRLADEFSEARTIYGGHGPIVHDAQAKIAEYIAHRQMREEQILDGLRRGDRTIPQLVRRIYSPAQSALWGAMARQILAHLLALQSEGRIVTRRLDRPLTQDEYTMLNPDLRALVGPDEAAALEAELGTEVRIESLDEYQTT